MRQTNYGFLLLQLMLLIGGFLLLPNLYADDTVGALPGQFEVSQSGAATYSIPIEVPPGINGL